MIKKISVILLICILLIAFFTWFANFRINQASEDRVYDDVNKISYRKVGLLLGASKMLANGRENLYFTYRIQAAVELYNAGKISFIIVSGDNSRHSYNEPLDMQTALMENGIPEEKIYLDYAGFRTLDSVVRMNKIFGQTSCTVISQEFHNKRAIFIAESKDIDMIGYNAKDVKGKSSYKTNIREVFARVKVFLDLLIDKDPKFLGDPIEIK